MARGSIVKRPSGNYAIVYYVNKSQKWKTIGPVKKEAEKALRDIMGQVDNGTYREQRRIPFSKFCDKWLEERKTRVKPTTHTFYVCIGKHLKGYFKDRPLHLIGPADVEAYLSFKTKEAKISPRTIGYHLTVLRMIFKKAIIWKCLKENPAQYIEKPRYVQPEMDFLNPEEVQQFLKHVDKRFYAIFLTAIMTGLRLGEILALRWSDINFFSKQVHVQRSVALGEFQEPKSRNSVRKVVMPPLLIKALKEHKKRLKVSSLNSDENDLVFPNKVGNLMDGRNLVQYHFQPTLKKAGLKRIRFHDLRHTYASLMIAAGENPKFIQHQLGHASIQTTLDRYGHLFPDAHNGAGERLQGIIFRDEKENTAKMLLRE